MGDIGGTNTRLRLWAVNSKDLKHRSSNTSLHGIQLHEDKYKNEQFNSFLEIFQHFLKDVKVPPVAACFAVAGPVTNNRVSFTNLDKWMIDGAEVSKKLGIKKVKLVNDFVAVGYGT